MVINWQVTHKDYIVGVDESVLNEGQTFHAFFVSASLSILQHVSSFHFITTIHRIAIEKTIFPKFDVQNPDTEIGNTFLELSKKVLGINFSNIPSTISSNLKNVDE